MEFPAFMIIVLFVVILLIATLAVYLYIYKRKINRVLITGESRTKMPAPYKIAAVLTVVLLMIGIVSSYFLGCIVTYRQLDADAESLSPADIQTYYAQVKEIGNHSLTVEGISLNEEQYRGTFQYEIWAETSIVYKDKIISLSDLKPGDMVSVTLVTAAGDITDIFKIQLLQQAKN